MLRTMIENTWSKLKSYFSPAFRKLVAIVFCMVRWLLWVCCLPALYLAYIGLLYMGLEHSPHTGYDVLYAIKIALVAMMGLIVLPNIRIVKIMGAFISLSVIYSTLPALIALFKEYF